jgi:biopolymer transport protein ExbD
MVDIVFVLMLFFMACAGWQMRERELGISLPTPSPDTNDQPTAVVIDIAADGRVIANDQVFGAAGDKNPVAFRDWLKTTQAFGDKNPIYIRPHPTPRGTNAS